MAEVTRPSPDPLADRFIDHLLADAKKTRLSRRPQAESDATPPAGLEEAVAEVGPPETVKALMDEPDPIAAVGKFMRQKTLRGV